MNLPTPPLTRHYWIAACLLFCPTLSVSLAQIDVNADGLPDVWQNFYSITLETSVHEDLDGDGWTALEESVAGTDPSSAESVLLGKVLASGAGRELHWHGVIGKTYRVEVMQEDGTWSNYSEKIPGKNEDLSVELPIAFQLLCRVRVSDNDFDQDQLTDWEESVVGSDPGAADSDQDGIPDGIEMVSRLDPLKKDTLSIQARTSLLHFIQEGGSTTISDGPAMPSVEARLFPVIRDTDERVEWRLETNYQPRQGKDARTYPRTNPARILSNEWWQAKSAFGGEIVGGDASLVARWRGMEWRMEFSIGGKNPEDAVARAYLDGKELAFPYPWAIVRHESRFGTRIYNQFTESGVPVFGPPDGWGMGQLDSARGRAVSTAEVWNWRVNLDSSAAMVEDIFTREAPAYFDAVRRTFPSQWEDPPNHTPPGSSTRLTAVEAATIQMYNGAGVVRSLKSPFGTMSNYRSCWAFDETAPSGQRWAFVPNKNDYVRKVVINEIEGRLSTSE